MSKKIGIEEFKSRSKDKWGDKFDYSLVEYKSQYEKVKIICPIHGEFLQIPKSHMNGNGCKKCSDDLNKLKFTGIKKIHKLDLKSIINRLIEKYDYDYSECVLEGKFLKNIICTEHGFFDKRLNNHLRQNQGCPKCFSNKSNIKEFIEKASLIHFNKYDYSEAVYLNSKTKIEIKCTEHGVFKQTPIKHLSGQGCTDCYSEISSKGEKYIREFLIENKVEFESQKIIPGTKLRFDFYILNKNIYIEYDGIQHFEPRIIFGGESEFLLQKKRDKIKNEYCLKNNIELIRISYKEFKNIKNILNFLLKN
jgi:very-short-patch-repair endonuclease